MAKQKPDIDKISLRMEAIWSDAELRIMQDVVRRIKQYKKITSTADYQINRLIDLGKSTEEIERILKESLDATYPEMYELYDEVINWQYVRNAEIYEQINDRFLPPEENRWMIQISEAVKKQTSDELKNIAQSYGFSVMMGDKRVFTPFATYYQKYVDAAIMDLTSGGFDYNTVIRRVVTQMTNSGLRTVDYASGHSNRTPVAVRRAVLTGLSQVTGKISERNAALLGTDYYEVDWHAGARPTHRIWQGKVYTYQELETICGLGTVTGLHGANCYHDYYPFFPGISERNWSDDWLEEQNQKEAELKSWNGKEYDTYGRTQKQRQMETAMRAQREKISLLKEAGADPDEIVLHKAKYQAQLNEYSRFCQQMKLPEQRERIYYDMRGRIATNDKAQNAMFHPEMIKNASKDVAQYKRYREVLGNSLGSLAKFGQVKYNDSEMWKFLQLDYERQKELKSHPELKLPNLENLVVSDTKFTKYLFGGENERGLAKGKAFSDRLGYDLGNWKELQKEICERAGRYPAYYRDNNGYGDRYEQKIIIYGKKGMPANVVVGWMARQDDTTSMSSTYIKEIKK